jgi:hypothetical protein
METPVRAFQAQYDALGAKFAAIIGDRPESMIVMVRARAEYIDDGNGPVPEEFQTDSKYWQKSLPGTHYVVDSWAGMAICYAKRQQMSVAQSEPEATAALADLAVRIASSLDRRLTVVLDVREYMRNGCNRLLWSTHRGAVQHDYTATDRDRQWWTESWTKASV